MQLGVAAFRRGNTALIVFDQPRSIDLSSLRDDAVLGSAVVQNLQTATVIRLTLDPAMALSPSRTPDAWHIAAVPREPTLAPIQATAGEDRLVLPAAAPGTVVSVVDPNTGATLLVGTQRREGQGVPAERRSPEFAVLPTWQGVAVEATADTITLRPTPQGFIVAGAPNLSPTSGIADQLTHAVGLTRQFDFPSQPVAALQQRLQRQIAEGAAAAPLARGPRRQAAARTMIALGLGAEAGAMLRMAAADDPHEADSPDNAALTAIAALLAIGRMTRRAWPIHDSRRLTTSRCGVRFDRRNCWKARHRRPPHLPRHSRCCSPIRPRCGTACCRWSAKPWSPAANSPPPRP
jgi:hypothetical protein